MSEHEAFPSVQVPIRYDGDFGAYVAGIAGAYANAHLDSMLLEGGDPGLIVGGLMPSPGTKSASTVEADIRQMFGYPHVVVRQRTRPRRRRHRRTRTSVRKDTRKGKRASKHKRGAGPTGHEDSDSESSSDSGSDIDGGSDQLDDYEVARELDALVDADADADADADTDADTDVSAPAVDITSELI